VAVVRDIQPFVAEVFGVAPGLRGKGITPLGEGMDNLVFLVGGEIVFRFAKHAEASDRLQREVSDLPHE
jgi:hypothetical protein